MVIASATKFAFALDGLIRSRVSGHGNEEYARKCIHDLAQSLDELFRTSYVKDPQEKNQEETTITKQKYHIYLNYDFSLPPIGTVEIQQDLPTVFIKEGVLVPYLVKRMGETKYKVISFGLIPRSQVDTSINIE